MSKRDRRLLERLHGMLGSSNASEAESARQRLLELLARYRKNWNDLTELLKGDADAGTWEPAWDDNRSAEQTAGDAIDAGLPEEAAKEPNALELSSPSRTRGCQRTALAHRSVMDHIIVVSVVHSLASNQDRFADPPQ